ncbi:MBL fold metallo-hydrolase [uncultured Jatrophihabitans sp.]|uniref:MBL fold metallo-hydrolase n=1 Tax=uncultured Jatrophihabitans sp. TaxID=1610747 RepID=UPI0035CACD90
MASSNPQLPPLSETERHAWENPGAFEAAAGVHRIPLPLPGDALKAVNIYAIPDGDKVVLIDGGWAMAESAELLAAGLKALGYGLGDVSDFYVTHHHRDHYTQAVTLRRKYGSAVSLGEGEREALEVIRASTDLPNAARMRDAGAADLARQIESWASGTNRGAELADYEDPDHWLADGVELPLSTRTLRVIATPGHTRGHVVFHDPEHDTLFAGDHVLPHITPSIGVETNRPPSPLRDYLASLALVRAMPDARLLPAHGPVTGSVHERIDELLQHHAQRLEITAEALDHGASTGFDVARATPWTRHLRRFDDLDLFNRIMAINETVAHLKVLVERGLAGEQRLDGVTHYART